MKQKFLAFLLLFLIVFPISRIVWQKYDYYSSPFNLELIKTSYENSQYVKEEAAGSLPDEFLFTYAGWYYINGGNPILVNPENPPLGKYIIGFSIKLFNNEKFPSLIFGFLSLFSLFLLSQLFLKKTWLALIPVVIFSQEKLFQEQFLYMPLFELFALTFLNFAFYFFIKAQKDNRYFLAASIFLGALWATRPWMATAPLIGCWLIYSLFFKKKLNKFLSWLISLPIAVAVLLLAYSKLFLEGWSIYKILSIQKWILWYHQSRLIKFGSIWPFIFLKRWYVWWGEDPYLPIVQWNVFWPIFTTIALVFSVLVILKMFGLKDKWLKNFEFDKKIIILCLWVVFYLVFLSIGNINSRYVFYLLPFCYLLGIYFLTCLWQTKLLNK